MEALRSAAPLSGKSNSVQPATRLIRLSGGSSQIFSEDTIMSNTPAPEGNRTPLSAHSIMFELWERNTDSFTVDELEWFKNAAEHAETLASDLEDVLEGLGCLILDDVSRLQEGTPCVGSFHGDGVPALLFFIAKNLNTIQGLIHVGDSARFKLAKLREKQTT